MIRLAMAMVTLCFIITITGCETIKGFGKDIENTGDNLQDVLNRSYDGTK